MSYIYKQYVKTIGAWPIDQRKSSLRNLRTFLEVQVEKTFKVLPNGDRAMANETETRLAERRLHALRQLSENRFLAAYPHQYITGHMGLTLEQLRDVNSEEGRHNIGLRMKKESLWKRIFN